jgi:hypothetical protein
MDQFVYRRLEAREVVGPVRHGREVPNGPTVGTAGTRPCKAGKSRHEQVNTAEKGAL